MALVNDLVRFAREDDLTTFMHCIMTRLRSAVKADKGVAQREVDHLMALGRFAVACIQEDTASHQLRHVEDEELHQAVANAVQESWDNVSKSKIDRIVQTRRSLVERTALQECQVQWRVPPGSTYRYHPQQLEAVVHELCFNAVKFGRDDGEAQVSVEVAPHGEREAPFLWFTITNTVPPRTDEREERWRSIGRPGAVQIGWRILRSACAVLAWPQPEAQPCCRTGSELWNVRVRVPIAERLKPRRAAGSQRG